MPRDLPIGNQSGAADAASLLVNYRCSGSFGEIYYPQVGLENQTGGTEWKLGVFVEGRGFAWLDDASLASSRSMNYVPNQMVARMKVTVASLQVEVSWEAFVDSALTVLVKDICVKDISPVVDSQLNIRLFLFTTPCLGAREGGNTASYDPEFKGMLVYNRDRFMLLSGRSGGSEDDEMGVSGYTVKWRFSCPWQEKSDMVRPMCESGILDNDGTRHGSVQTAVALDCKYVEESKEFRCSLVMFFARSEAELHQVVDKSLLYGGLRGMRARTELHWDLWLNQKLAIHDASGLGREISHVYNRSLMVLRTHSDNGGAFLAAIDWDVHREQKETYSYCWMRDAGYACEVMSRNQCPEMSEALFGFAKNVLAKQQRNGNARPYFLQKYCSDGTPGSSWMSRIDGPSGKARLPIQQDESASLLIAVARHHRLHPKYDLARTSMIIDVVFPVADWICDWRLPSGLPKPSHDLWEERDGIHLQTLAVVYGALVETSFLAQTFGDFTRAKRYSLVAAEISSAARDAFPLTDRGWLPRMRRVNYDLGTLEEISEEDKVLDAGGAAALFQFACPPNAEPLFPAEAVKKTMEAVKLHLWVRGGVGGVARYQMDPYCADSRCEYGRDIPGNPWIICTLWLAEWYIFTAECEADLSRAVQIINWVVRNAALPSGVLAEQLHPTTGKPLGVSPLAWSHSTFVSTIQRYQLKRRILKET